MLNSCRTLIQEQDTEAWGRGRGVGTVLRGHSQQVVGPPWLQASHPSTVCGLTWGPEDAGLRLFLLLS